MVANYDLAVVIARYQELYLSIAQPCREASVPGPTT